MRIEEPGLSPTDSILIADRGGNMKPSWMGSKRVGKNRSESGPKFRFAANSGYSPPVCKNGNPCELHGVRRALVFVANEVNREILEDQLSAGGVAMHDEQDSSAALTAVGPLPVSRLGSQSLTALLPDMAGVEWVRTIKNASEDLGPQIILLTSFDQDVGEIERSEIRLLTKPIRQSAL
jgi:CheY-like chemotaxis protein